MASIFVARKRKMRRRTSRRIKLAKERMSLTNLAEPEKILEVYERTSLTVVAEEFKKINLEPVKDEKEEESGEEKLDLGVCTEEKQLES